jgi:hypothetical protein
MLPAKHRASTARPRAANGRVGVIVATVAMGFLALMVCARLMESIAPSGSVTIPVPTISFPMPALSALVALVLLAVGLGIHGWATLAPRKTSASAAPVYGVNVVPFPRSDPARRGNPRAERVR